jgi:hypothetical protein
MTVRERGFTDQIDRGQLWAVAAVRDSIVTVVILNRPALATTLRKQTGR